MSDYTVHDVESAPEGATDLLNQIHSSMGFIPNIAGVMAESPALARAYFTLSDLFDETSFSPTERQAVLLTVSHDNNCGYCMAAHSVIASMQKVPENVVDAIRNNRSTGDEKLEALRHFTRAVVDKRGWVDQKDLDAFFAAGYQQHHVLEVILGIGMKTLSNYTNHIADTPLDEAFASQRWKQSA